MLCISHSPSHYACTLACASTLSLALHLESIMQHTVRCLGWDVCMCVCLCKVCMFMFLCSFLYVLCNFIFFQLLTFLFVSYCVFFFLFHSFSICFLFLIPFCLFL